LRELTYLFEDLGQAWAGRMIDLLRTACHEVGQTGAPLPESRRAFFLSRYADILSEGEALNPRAPRVLSATLRNPGRAGLSRAAADPR
jgi:hypothetical protein